MDLFGEDIKEPPEAMANPEASEAAPASSGLKEPRSNPLLFGHVKAEAHLLDLIHHDHMPHGLVISGPQGIGKSTLAFRLARFLLARPIADINQDALFDDAPAAPMQTLALDPDAPDFRRVASGGHPDLLTIERGIDTTGKLKSTLDVAQLRKVAPFLRKTASSGGWRVVVIDDADMMNRNAQNALLKILEEPPAHTVLILVTHKMGALIPTIRSRTQVLNLQAPPITDFQKILALKGHHFGDRELAALYELSGGAVGKALQLIEQGGLDLMERIIGVFQNYPRFDNSQIHTLAADMGRKGQEAAFENFCEILSWIASQLLFAKARGRDFDAGPMNQDIFKTMLTQSSLEQLIEICENLKDHFTQVSRANLEKRFAVLAAFEVFKTRD